MLVADKAGLVVRLVQPSNIFSQQLIGMTVAEMAGAVIRLLQPINIFTQLLGPKFVAEMVGAVIRLQQSLNILLYEDSEVLVAGKVNGPVVRLVQPSNILS